jgi:hypothetical protein
MNKWERQAGLETGELEPSTFPVPVNLPHGNIESVSKSPDNSPIDAKNPYLDEPVGLESLKQPVVPLEHGRGTAVPEDLL